MKIKLAILEKDISYLNRFVNVFSTKYAEKMEIYSFTDKQVALSALVDMRIDVFIVSDAYEINVNEVPKKCSFAYFVDSSDVESINGQQVICKFQKIDLIYKQILNLYSENAGNISNLKLDNDDSKIITFVSPAGGTGSSTMAAACAVHFAMQGKKTLYLNIEKYGYADEFFQADGQFDMSDVIYALKSKKTNLSIKLESCVKQDPRGVYFYSKSKNTLDILELKSEEIIQMLTQLKILGTYEYIILDMDFGLEKAYTDIYRNAHEVIWISDGSPISNDKLRRAYHALATMEMNADVPLTRRTNVIYNRFHKDKGQMVQDIDVRTIGGAPCIRFDTINQMLDEMAKLDVFDKII